jgi:ribose transport system substrate-binding protein
VEKENNMKRAIRISLITLLMACVAVAAFAGGGKEVGAKKEGIVIGFSNAGMGDSWRQFLVANFNAEVAAHPEITQAYLTNADEKPEKQLADIDDLLVKGVDALIVYPTVADAIIPAIERVYDQGVPVIVFGGTIDTDKYTCLVMEDLLEFGRAQATWLAEELKGKGKIVMLSGIAGNTTAEDRLAGAREVFKKYPGIEILDHQYCDWSPPKAKSIMEAMIQAFPQIDGIWADSGLMSWPALQALKEAGRPLVPSTGDQLNGYTKFLVANNVRGYAYPMTTKLSGEAVRQAVKAVKGEKVDKIVYIDIKGYGPDQIKKLTKPELSDWWWIGDDQMPAEFLPEL